jgi:isopentenyl phosphate kinase
VKSALRIPQSEIKNQKSEIVFLKLGGSLITDKTKSEHAHTRVIRRLAREIKAALTARPNLKLVLGHGSGSFGHVAAKKYGTREGIKNEKGWIGFAKVAASAARLNQIVTDIFIEADVPVISLPPSASARCEDGQLIYLDTFGIRSALNNNLVPLVQGDVALDITRGATIISTEDVFTFLSGEIKPSRMLLAGEVEGVFASAKMSGSLIDLITPVNIARYRSALGGARGTDVTGGMIGKVDQMLKLVNQHPAIKVKIFSGSVARNVERLLIDPALQIGTTLQYVEH